MSPLVTPLAVLAAGAIAVCGSARASPAPRHDFPSGAGHTAGATGTSRSVARSSPRPVEGAAAVRVSRPVDHYPVALAARWQTIATIGGLPGVWVAVRQGVTLVRMNQRVVDLALHAGSVDPGGPGWRYGAAVRGRGDFFTVLSTDPEL